MIRVRKKSLAIEDKKGGIMNLTPVDELNEEPKPVPAGAPSGFDSLMTPRRDENGYVPGSAAAKSPFVEDKQAQLERMLEEYNRQIERGRRTGGGAARDADMRSDLLSSVQTGLALEKERPGQGMNIDDALARLSAGAETNRLQYATTNTTGGARLASRLGLPESLPRTRGDGGGSYKLADAWGTVNEQTQKQSLSLEQILHPEKFREEQVFNQGSLGLTKLDKKLQATTIPGTARPPEPAPEPAADVLKETPVGYEYGGRVYSYSAYGKGSDGRIYQRSDTGELIGEPGQPAAAVPAATDDAQKKADDAYNQARARFESGKGLFNLRGLSSGELDKLDKMWIDSGRLIESAPHRGGVRTVPAASASVQLPNADAVQWAKANPNDPRSAEILKRNGM